MGAIRTYFASLDTVWGKFGSWTCANISEETDCEGWFCCWVWVREWRNEIRVKYWLLECQHSGALTLSNTIPRGKTAKLTVSARPISLPHYCSSVPQCTASSMNIITGILGRLEMPEIQCCLPSPPVAPMMVGNGCVNSPAPSLSSLKYKTNKQTKTLRFDSQSSTECQMPVTYCS